MTAWALLVFALLKYVAADLNPDNELYVSFESLPGQRGGWPLARAVRMQFTRKSEEGREYRSFEGCQLLESLDDIAREATRTPQQAIQRISKEAMQFFEGRCQRMGDAERTVWGTKWCGAGNEAENEGDLGYFSNLDICCRDHDHCDNIGAGETKYNLTNTGTFTMMNCDCEVAFKNCLDSIPGFWTKKAIAAVKMVYFNLYGNGCYNLKCSGGRSENFRIGGCASGVAEYTGETGPFAKIVNIG
nr:heterodimeric group phospholipase A2 isoform x1 [Hemiscorpius lepturus]